MVTQVIFWDVDTQIDFMLPGRSLYVSGAEEILPQLLALTRHARETGIRILGSEDSHSPADAEISTEPDWKTTFPPHCLAGTEGQRRVAETAPIDPLYVESAPVPAGELAAAVRSHTGEILFRKQTFDGFSNPNVEPVLDLLGPSWVVIYGVAQDVCVNFAVDGFLRRGREEVLFVTDATRALDLDRARELERGWRTRGARPVTTADVLAQVLAKAPSRGAA